MRFERVERFWKTLLRARTTLNEEAVRVLEEQNFRGNERHVLARVNRQTLQVFGPNKLVPGAEVDVLFEVRNDGSRRISFLTWELCGIEMSLKHVVKHILSFVGACDSARRDIMERVFKDEKDES